MSRDPRKITGADLQDAIVDLARARGFIAAHFRNSRTASGGHSTAVAYDGKGFPDLVLARSGVVLFLEVKGDGDRVRPDQQKWIDALYPTTAGRYTWATVITGDDWRSGRARGLIERAYGTAVLLEQRAADNEGGGSS